MAVVLDLVFNHMGASDDVVGSFDPANDWANPSTYWYSGKTDWGPRFNYSNPVIAKFLTDSAKYMLQHYKVDGFRYDATYYICYNNYSSDGGSFLYDMTRKLHAYDANAILIAENLPSYSWITESSGGDFNFQWESGLSSELKKLFYDGTTSFSVATVASYLSTGSRVLYMSSHDECANGKERTAADLNFARSWGNSEYDAQCQQITGLANILMGPARPMMFMGDEFLEGFYDHSYWDFL
jgi:1,4-alpha-glucan branching enzyme